MRLLGLIALVFLGCAPGRDCAPQAKKLATCSEEWTCPGGNLRWTCDGGSCECAEGDSVVRTYASHSCPFSNGDSFEQAGDANAACGWAIPYNP